VPESTPLLIFACVYTPENIIGAFRPARFAKYLPRFGYQPLVITASPQPETGAPENVSFVPFHVGLAERVLTRLRLSHDDRYTWTGPAAAAAERLLSRSPRPVLFSTSPPVSVHLAALRLKRRYGLGWIADFRDPLVGHFGRTAPQTRWIDRRLERRIAEQADILLLNTPAAADEWQRRYPHRRDCVRFLYNGFDPEDGFGPRPVPPRPFRLWIHSGSTYLNRYPIRLLNALAALMRAGRWTLPLRLRMIGSIGDPSLFDLPAFGWLKEKGVLDCYPDALDREQAWRETAEADAGIVFDHYRAAGNLQVPAKAYDYIRVGRPICAFTSRGTPLESVLRLSGIRHVTIWEEDPPETIEDKLLAFAELPNEALPASAEFHEQFSAPAQTRRLAELLDRLGG